MTAQQLILPRQAAILQKQFAVYEATEWKNLIVPVKLFALNSSWTWYLVTQNPDDPDYLQAIVVDNEIEFGPVTLRELVSLKWMGIPTVERDIHWKPMSVETVWNKLLNRQPVQ